MKTAELKTKIRNYLESVEEATAKQITKAINHEKYPSEVISALGEMRTDAEIEYEKKKGKGNECWYWLIKAANTEPVAPTDKECCNAAKVMATTASAELETMRQLVEAKQGRIDELEAFQQRLFLQLEFVPGEDIEHRVAQVMHERIHGQQKIADLEDDVRRHNDRLQEVSATIVRFLVVVHQLSGNAHKPVNLHEAEQQIATTFETMRSRVEELEATIHAMELDDEQSKEVTDVAVGYLVKAPKRRPRVITSPDRAREAALSAARQHGRGEVLALVPVGKAVRGAEWKEAA